VAQIVKLSMAAIHPVALRRRFHRRAPDAFLVEEADSSVHVPPIEGR
jgi:hypothetical protein